MSERIEDLEAAIQLLQMQLKDIDNILQKPLTDWSIPSGKTLLARIIDQFTEMSQVNGTGLSRLDGRLLSVFESYSERQRREDYIEIVNCKKEYLENLIKDLKTAREVQERKLPEEGHREAFADLSSNLEGDILNSGGRLRPWTGPSLRSFQRLRIPLVLRKPAQTSWD